MDQPNCKQKSRTKKRKPRNKKSKNQSQSNENKLKLSNIENQNSNLNKCNYQLASSPRPTNISKNNDLFETKRSSGSEFEEFHTPSCEYPDLNNVELSKEKELEKEWDDIGSFKASSLEGIPEISFSHNLISKDYSNLNGNQNLSDNKWQSVCTKRSKLKSNKISNGFVPKENPCSSSKLETEATIQIENNYILETTNQIESGKTENIDEYFHDCSTTQHDLSIESQLISYNDDNNLKSISHEITETVDLEVSWRDHNEEEQLYTYAIGECSQISKNHFTDETEIAELRNDNDDSNNNDDDNNNSNNNFDENIDNRTIDSFLKFEEVNYLNSENETYDDHINDIEPIKDNSTDESDNGLSSLELETENIYCTDENLDSEILLFSEVKVEYNYKINNKKSMTYTARDLNDSYRQSATTITNVTSISDENINLNYQNDLKKAKINKKGKKIFSNIFSKFKKRKLIKPENIENPTAKVENNLPVEQMDFFDEASIECNSQTKGLEIDSNKALKSYDDSINNFGEVKPNTDDECTESDNVFIGENLNCIKYKENNREKLSENNFIEDYDNQTSPGKIALRNDIESLDNSFKFLKDFEKDSIKTDNEELIISEENIIDDLKCEIPNLVFIESIIKQEKQPENLEIKIKSLEDVREKIDENVSLNLQHQLSLNANSKKKRKRKFPTFFTKKKKNEINLTKSLSRENIENSNDKEYLKCDNNNHIEFDCKPISEFNKILNDLENKSFIENEKVICKNKNDYPLNTTEECLINKEVSFINDDHLFPDAITPSKIIHFDENDLYNFPFIDDPIIIAQDSLTMFKGENKKMIILTEFIAPFASLETLSKLEKHAPFASSESLHSQENHPGKIKISEISKSPLRINKRPLNSLMGIFSRTR